MNIEKPVFFMSLIWYFYTYGPPPFIFNLMLRFYCLYNNLFEKYNEHVYSQWNNELNEIKSINTNNDNYHNNEFISLQPPKYEDKYLDDIRKLNKQWEFTVDETEEIPNLIDIFFNGYIESKTYRIEEITKEIINLEKEISNDNDDIKCCEDFDNDGNETFHLTLEERNDERREKIKKLQKEYNTIKLEIESEEGLNEFKNKSIINANNYIINKRLDKLKNCYIIEKTPVGNVLMIYDKEKESFKYYSDCNIPYRYLEVVGRKYIKLFNCRPIFVDMEEELKLFEEKWEKDQELKKKKKEEKKKKEKEE